MKILSLAQCALLIIIPGLSSAAENYTVPRTEWGLPDLQGVWNFSSDSPMERPAEYGTRQYLTDEEVAQLEARLAARDATSDAALPDAPPVEQGYNDFWIESAGLDRARLTSHIIYPEDGRLPELQEGALRPSESGEPPQRPVRTGGRNIGTDGPEDTDLADRCIMGFNAGPPVRPALYNNNLQIVQNRDHVVIIIEMAHHTRMVPLGDRPHPPEEIGLWSGDSRGYWEGDTLVVETRNFNGLTPSFGSFGSSENKQLTEKFTRVAEDQLDYEFTVEDPSTFTDKIVGLIPMYKVAGQLYEYACHEGNYSMTSILRGARVQEQLAD